MVGRERIFGRGRSSLDARSRQCWRKLTEHTAGPTSSRNVPGRSKRRASPVTGCVSFTGHTRKNVPASRSWERKQRKSSRYSPPSSERPEQNDNFQFPIFNFQLIMIEKLYVVPGQPHILLAPEKNPGWNELNRAYKKIGEEIARSGAELMLVYSTQWFSVIGHLMQVDPNPEWVLVDQNWYELGEMPYSFRIDPEFGKLYCATAKSYGMQASTVNYHGSPIDTGTVVALKLLNPDNAIPASVVSCNIYAEREETRALGRAGREALDHYGKRTIVVVGSNLSNRYEVAEIAPEHDRTSSQ